MNQYSLLFSDQKKEKEYEQENMDNIRKILLYLFHSLLCFVGLIYMVFGTFQASTSSIYGIIASSYSLFAIPITYLGLLNYQKLLILCNATILLLQFTVDHESTNQSFLRGSNTMMMHCSIIYACDFPQAIFQILMLFFVKLMPIIYVEQIPFQIIVAMTLTCVFFGAICYRLIKINRRQFLLRLSSHNWDNILYQVVEKNFCYFYFNQAKNSFQLCQSNMFSKSQSEFLNFLRRNKIGKQTVEQYLFKNITYFQDTQRTECEVKDAKSTKKLIIISFFIESPSFIIMIENQNQILKIYDDQVQKINKYCQSTLTSLSKVNLRFLHQGIEKENKQFLLQLRYVYFKYILKKSRQSIRTFNIFKQVQFITTLIYLKDKIFVLKCSDENIQVTTIYSQFLFLLIEITEAFISQKIEIIINQSQQQDVTLQFVGKFRRDYIKFGKYHKIVSDHSYQIRLRQSQLNIQLNQDISYMNSVKSLRIQSPKHLNIPLK